MSVERIAFILCLVSISLHLDVFEQLADDIRMADNTGEHEREIELTSALEAVRKRSGMIGLRIDGEMFDMGNPEAMRNAVLNFSK